MKTKTLGILLNAFPIIFMVSLIPIVKNDYILTLLYLLVISLAFYVHNEKLEGKILIIGFFIMLVSEYFFISTKVEVFKRRSLLNVMPLWLPFLWAYGFVAIKRAVKILEQ